MTPAAAFAAAGIDAARQTIVEVPDAGNTCCVLAASDNDG